MKLKIFKSTLYTIIMVLSIHTYANSQGVSPDKEKALEDKLNKLESKLQSMQGKLDSMKALQKGYVYDNLVYVKTDSLYKYKNKGTYAVAPRVKVMRVPKAALAPLAGLNEDFSRAFEGLNKTMNSNFNFDADAKLEEKVKSGEIKEKVKNYSKSYSVSSSDKLQIDNSYGRVTVNTWNKNEFKVDVEIKGLADDDAEAQKLLDGVSITDGKSGGVVSFTTNIDSPNGNHYSWGSWTSNGKTILRAHKVEVNYTIYMPSKSALSITNKYGGTVLPDFDGKVVINSSYGSFTAKTLTNPGNDITSRYGSTNIESLNGSDLKVAYGSLVLGTSDNLNADISYGSAKIDKIKTSGNITVKYSGALRIGDLDKNFKNLSINSSYSSVLMGLNNDAGFDYDVTVSYGNFNYGDHAVTVSNKATSDDDRTRWNPTKNYKGHLGKSNSDKLVTITAKYGSVKFD